MIRVAISSVVILVAILSLLYGRAILSHPEIGEYFVSSQIYRLKELPLVAIHQGKPIFLGGFSGLEFLGEDPVTKSLHFRTITDRGPNMNLTELPTGQKARPFAHPDYQVQWAHFSLPAPSFTKKVPVARFWNVTGLTDTEGVPLVGLPNYPLRDELPMALDGTVLKTNPMGVDPEGITHDQYGHTWVAEEYGPSLLEFHPSGQLIRRYVPAGSGYRGRSIAPLLPKSYARRKKNRGFEGLTYFQRQLFAFMQSPIESVGSPSSRSRVMRILRFNTAERQVTGEFLYLLDDPEVDKLGDAVAIGANRFLVIEQNPDHASGPVHQLFELDLQEASNVAHSDVDFESMSPEQIADLGLHFARKKKIIDLGFLGKEFSKIEGLVVISPHLLALAADNDFGLVGADGEGEEFGKKDSLVAILRLPTRLF